MSESPGKKAEIKIKKILKKNNRMRHGKLRDLIVNPKDGCSKRTFDKTLERLETSLQITRDEKSRNVVWYETNDFKKKQNTYNEFLEEELQNCDKNLNLFLDYVSIFNDKDRAVFIHNIIESVHYLQTMILLLETLPEIRKSEMIDDGLIKKIDNFKHTLYYKCSKFLSDQELLNHVLLIKGSRFNKNTEKIKNILDAIPY